MRRLGSYPEYWDSKVPFLGEVPVGWSVQPAVTLARVLTSTVDKHSVDGELATRLCNYTDVYYNDEINENADYMLASATRDQISSYSVTAGDVVFTKDSETADDIGISAYVPETLPGVVYGYHLSTYRPKDRRYGKFLKWVLDSKYAKATLQTRTLGVTRVGLSQNTVRYLRIPTPPPNDAVQISEFLDRETAEIDAFIADQEELIRLLAERRAATISHSVTKGLDPSIRMKDSGVEWLGEVPEHWVVTRVSRYFSVTLGKMLDAGKDPVRGAQVLPYIRAANIQEPGLDLKSVYEMPFTAVEARNLDIRAGDLLVVEGGAVGVNVYVDSALEGWSFQKTVNRVRPLAAPGESRFLGFALDALRGWGVIDMVSNKSTIAHLTAEKLERLVFGFPPAQEQARIVSHLSAEVAELNAAIADAREAIALSKERRAALISAAVTGTIDVRGGV